MKYRFHSSDFSCRTTTASPTRAVNHVRFELINWQGINGDTARSVLRAFPLGTILYVNSLLLGQLRQKVVRGAPVRRRNRSQQNHRHAVSPLMTGQSINQRRATSVSSQVATTSGRDRRIKWKWFERIAKQSRSIPKHAARRCNCSSIQTLR